MEDANDETTWCDTCPNISHGFLKLRDGRHLCSDCSSIVVMTQEECDSIIQDVFEFFRELKLGVNENIPISFIHNDQMLSLLKRQGEEVVEDETVLGLFLPSVSTVSQTLSTYNLPSKIWYLLSKEIYPKLLTICTILMRRECSSGGVNIVKFVLGDTILVLAGKPDVEMGGVLAHEMMHAWLYLQGKPWEWERSVVEGICEVMCYEWLEWFSSKGFNSLHKTNEQVQHTRNLKDYLAKEIELNDDEVYGKGFRDAMAAIKSWGLKYTLDHIIKNGTLPPP